LKRIDGQASEKKGAVLNGEQEGKRQKDHPTKGHPREKKEAEKVKIKVMGCQKEGKKNNRGHKDKTEG